MNPLFQGPVPNPSSPPIIPGQRQFGGVGVQAGGSSARAATGTPKQVYPSALYGTTAAIVLQRGTVGAPAASGGPRYLLGDVILPPATQLDGVQAADASYWRAKPIEPGELFSHPEGGADAAPVPALPAGKYTTYYYSPHAGKVFAAQSGRVSVKWVTQLPIADPTNSDVNLRGVRYRYKEEIFAVSGATAKPIRSIYWTKRDQGFTSPAVNIPSGSITTVNPIYTNNFPRTVATEYQPPGGPSGATAEPRTLWFDPTSGSINAYNLEGRVMVEYLGALKPGSSTEHVFLGADIVEVARLAPSINSTVLLGDRLTARDEQNRALPLDSGPEWLASPVISTSPDAKSYYGTSVRADGKLLYYAERENENPDRVSFYWLQGSDAAIHFLPPPASPNLGIYWPQQRNNYIQIWPAAVTQFHAHYTVGGTGSNTASGTSLAFAGGQLPQVIFQDDGAQTEAIIDPSTQRLNVSVAGDGLNRALLKFTNGTEVWYVRLYTQADERIGFLEGDAAAVVTGNAYVGERINPPSGYSAAGYIAGGTGYNPVAYKDPFVVGVPAAEKAAIIPVNAVPSDTQLKVWWFKVVAPPNSAFTPLYVPAKVGRYTVSYPTSFDKIVLASNAGSGDLAPAEIAGSLYVQNDRTLPGFNPNEEHALMLGGRAYALRDDLNDITADATPYTSQPFVLINYTSPTEQRPAMRVFKVVREEGVHVFNYPITAGTILQGPMPLPLLPLPVNASNVSRNTEVPGVPDPAPSAQAPGTYATFTFKDRKGYDWVYRGPHAAGTPTLGMQFYYTMREGFFIPGAASPPAVGTILPYLRPFDGSSVPQGDPITGTSLTITYRPVWPVNAPELRVAESLTLPKFGLPAVLNQTSAQVLYQQSVAVEGTTKPSVTLHDPIREKIFPLGAPGQLAKLPTSVRTTPGAGKTHFQGLPPHLQNRFFFDPARGAQGALVLLGVFVDEPAGEDYLNLNVLSTDDVAKLNGLVTVGDVDESAWSAAISGLTTRVETFVADPAKAGTFKVGPSVTVSGTQLATVENPDIAVAKYALTATGQGTGWVTLLFGDGRAFTPAGEPVAMQIIKVAPQLYTGELKVNLSSNPLDEQVTLRHSGDFAAKPDDYEFEWRYGVPQDGVSPPTYTYALTPRIGANWQFVQRPKSPLPSATDYDSALVVPVPQSLEVNTLLDSVNIIQGGSNYQTPPVVTFSGGGGSGATALATLTGGVVTVIKFTSRGTGYITLPEVKLNAVEGDSGTGATAVAIAATSATAPNAPPGYAARHVGGVDFTTGVPAQIVFSADLGDRVGFVLYVNSVAALGFNAPAPFVNTPASTGLATDGLSRQFAVPDRYFTKGVNSLEVALYSTSDVGITTSVKFQLHASAETDMVVAGGSPWQTPNGVLLNQAIVGGSASAPLGSPLLVMSDNYFTMRYRPKIAKGHVLATGADQSTVAWSRWMPPKLVEGWIKRVLAGINPFNQRVRDLFNNAVNTDVSILTQAGSRWEGNVALNLANINDFGLIEIYETVLNRGKNMSIGSGYDYAPANDALLLAAGYLHDLYTVLGNEAFADAANPTISIDDSTTITEVNTSRFSFEGQVKSVLEEELALLRGRDDFLAPGITVAPAYNRMYWNYTRGINSGEALYAVNYNIREKAGSPTADGNLDAADAQRMFPQGHGDAYGHYLTALTGYYRLLTHSNFTWTPRSEAVTVLGQAVQIDYFDERKFASAAASVARTAEQVIALTHRQSYKDDPAAGWSHFRDGKVNPNTGATRHWGLDEWASRATQGAYLNWVVGNAILPETDNNPTHTGVQIVDRKTVPALAELPPTAANFQLAVDNANSRLNPLGLSPGAIAFDISPSELKAGKSHYEQIHDRALRAVLNAKGAFDQAAKMTRLLRNQENQVGNANDSIVDQERAFIARLIEIYGTPYTGDIGPGKTYAQGYAGPDLFNWFVVDRPSEHLVDTAKPVTVTLRVPTNVRSFDVTFFGFKIGTKQETYDIRTFPDFQLSDIRSAFEDETVERTFAIQPDQIVQYSDVWPAGGGAFGTRSVTGTLQQALLDGHQARLALLTAADALKVRQQEFEQRYALFQELLKVEEKQGEISGAAAAEELRLAKVKHALTASGEVMMQAADAIEQFADKITEFFPKVVGLATDTTSVVRGEILVGSLMVSRGMMGVGTALLQGAERQDLILLELQQKADDAVGALASDYALKQFAYEYEQLYRKMVASHFEIAHLATNLQRSAERVRNVVAEGNRVQADRETFRQRAAAIVQGYRTKDLTFRTFRNEALEQYRSLFDLASRYTYLAAKSYDYETGLLGTTAGQSVVAGIVASRALGDLAGGTPQATVSTLGDAGLAGTMARMQADWSVAKGRLGINNPDQNGTLFSLRRELFRLVDDPTRTDDEAQWRQTLEQHIMSNVLADADVAAHARNLRKADGSAVPGIVIPFSTTIQAGLNFFGLPYAAGDHAFSPSNYATKIYSVGLVFRGYVGMDPFSAGTPNAGAPSSTAPNALGATPYAYLIPTGADYMLAPPLGDTATVRLFNVHDQALPLPFNLGATQFSTTQFFNANGTLNEQPWILRKHQAFRPVNDPSFFYSSMPAEFTSSRLVGRSVWNGGWKLVIPAFTLLSSEQDGLTRFVASVKDIELFLRTYSHSGN